MPEAVLEAVKSAKREKSRQELEIERLSALAPSDLNSEDLKILRRIRDCRASVVEVENQLEEVKERKKLRVSSLDAAILEASMYFENRQLALSFGK